MQGFNVQIGRFISIPDIEAQLAPNNYTYAHSLTYIYDNFTNTGILGTLAVTKNWIVQLGVVASTDTMPWNIGARIAIPIQSALSGNDDAQGPRRAAVCHRWLALD